jgi:hypothetical protein
MPVAVPLSLTLLPLTLPARPCCALTPLLLLPLVLLLWLLLPRASLPSPGAGPAAGA